VFSAKKKTMEPMRCYECGAPVSNLWDAFIYMRELLLKEQESTTDITLRSIDPEINQRLLPIFQALYIEDICTRKIFLTSKNIHTF
jgi:DNA-directed RNA polymerase subunit N (RpoN/RPB10)